MLGTFLQLTDAVVLNPANLLLQHLLVDHVGVLQVVVPAHPGHHLQAVRPLDRHGDQGDVNAGVDETGVVAEQLRDLRGRGSLGWYRVPAASQQTGSGVIKFYCKERRAASGLIF